MRSTIKNNMFSITCVLFVLLFSVYIVVSQKSDSSLESFLIKQAHDICVENGFDTYLYPSGGFHDSMRDIRCMKKEYSDYIQFNRLTFTAGETIKGKNDIVYNCENKAHTFPSDEDCITCNVWRNSFEGYYDNDLLKKYKCIN